MKNGNILIFEGFITCKKTAFFSEMHEKNLISSTIKRFHLILLHFPIYFIRFPFTTVPFHLLDFLSIYSIFISISIHYFSTIPCTLILHYTIIFPILSTPFLYHTTIPLFHPPFPLHLHHFHFHSTYSIIFLFTPFYGIFPFTLLFFVSLSNICTWLT